MGRGTKRAGLPRCRDCGQVMLEAEGCTLPALVDGAGQRYERIRFGDAREGWGQDVGEALPLCGDCACRLGGVHHAGCDIERCPVCGSHLLACTMFGWHAGERGPLGEHGPSHGGLRPCS